MEKVLNELASLEERCKPILSKTQLQKSHLYCEGLRAKLTQTSYALERLMEINKLSDDDKYTITDDDKYTFTGDKAYPIRLQVSFFCDSFWTFLYSSLDVLSQIVNQTMNLGLDDLDEKNVSFAQVKGKLQGNQYVTTQVSKAFDDCFKSHAYKNLDKYRNCSNHRREIFIVETYTSVKGTSGYATTSTGGSGKTVTRILCDDPLTLLPTIEQKRKIPDYMMDTMQKIEKFIAEIIKKIEPCKKSRRP